ncbi:MAG TPA: hypothetical protein PLV83_02060 [Bacilli bacterium]|nr:hypothetical protein [Bacilli bacterium]
MKTKHKYLLTLLFLIGMIILPGKVFASATWVPDAAGAGYNGSGHGGACLGTSNCFCNWNNGNYAAAYVEIRYYDGSGSFQQITSRKVVGNGSTSWIASHIDRNFIYWNKFPTQLNGTFANSLNATLMNASGDYANMRELFSLLGANYNDILNKVKTGVLVNGLLGSKKGIRVVVTPIFSIQQIYDATNIGCVSIDYQNSLVRYINSSGSNGDRYYRNINRSNLQSFMNNPSSYFTSTASSNYGVNYAAESIITSVINGVSEDDGGYYVYTGTLAELSATNINEILNQGSKYNFKRTGAPTQVLRPSQYKTFAKVVYTPKTDIFAGHNSANEAESLNTGNQILETSGWGVGLYLPFDHLDPNYTPEEPIPTTPETVEPNGCTYEIKTDIPSTCGSDDNSGYVKDIDDWECIFKSKTSVDANVRSHYIENSDNKYCNIFCREEITLNYPGNNITVDQGKYMVVNNSDGAYAIRLNPIEYKGKKTCMPSSDRMLGQIDYQTFNDDLQAINQRVKTAWDNYQKRLADQYAANAANPTGETADDTSDCAQEEKRTRHICDCNTLSGTDRIRCNETHACDKEVEYTVCVRYYKTRKWSGSANNGRYSGSASWWEKYEGHNQGPSKDDKKREYENIANAAKTVYDDAVAARNNLINKFASCTGILPNITYTTFKPELEFTYEEPVYGNTWTLTTKLTDESKDSTFWLENGTPVKFGNTNLFKSFTVYKCDNRGQYCNESNRQSILYSMKWASEITKEYNYSLPEDTYRYTEKGSGQTVDGRNRLASKQYIDIGYSTLPVHYSTDPGTYDYSLTTNTYGTGNKFDKYVLLGTLFANKSCRADKDYPCTYEVPCNDQRISCTGTCSTEYDACDPTLNCNGTNCAGSVGVNVVYRTISLYSKQDAFPGFNGDGRKPGANWDSENDYTVNTYIINNRGVSDYNVYHLQPMYEISLTPKTMKLLRRYNKYMNSKIIDMYEGTSAATSGIAGYSDFENMTCTNGRNCKSGLIRGRVNSYEINVTGCAISSSGSYTNCGNTVAW